MVAADREVAEQMRRLCVQCARKLTPGSKRKRCGPCLRQNREDAIAVEHPTQEEIAAGCAEAQAKWSHADRMKRAGAVRAMLLRLPDEVLFGRRR